MIQNGRVSVNGQVAKLGDRLEDENAIVRIDGHRVSVKDSEEVICRVLAYNKPEGELCTRHDPEGRRTVFDRLPKIKGSRPGFQLAVLMQTPVVCCYLLLMVN